MIKEIEDLMIDPHKAYGVEEAHKYINKMQEVAKTAVYYYCKKGYLKSHKAKRFGMGQDRWAIMGEDLQEFIKNKRF